MRTHRSGLGLALLATLAFAGCGGETVVSGIGNSGNVIGAAVSDLLAQELAEQEAIPAVTDEELRAVFAAIREQALAGDREAALVLLKVAAEQREGAGDE